MLVSTDTVFEGEEIEDHVEDGDDHREGEEVRIRLQQRALVSRVRHKLTLTHIHIFHSLSLPQPSIHTH